MQGPYSSGMERAEYIAQHAAITIQQRRRQQRPRQLIMFVLQIMVLVM